MLTERTGVIFSKKSLAVVTGALLLAGTTAYLVSLTRDKGNEPAAQATNAESNVASREPQFDSPFADGVMVQGLQQAAKELELIPVAPDELGPPVSFVIHDPARVSKKDQALGLVYRSALLGAFVVIQDSTDETTEQLAELAAACDPGQGCEGTWKMMDLTPAQRGLLIAGPGSVGIIWIRGRRRFDVYGPPESFSIADATTVAQSFIARTPEQP